jgi:uncharacterized protein YrzB (UPF0473 family)
MAEKDKNNTPEDEIDEEIDIITLTGEDGEEHDFEVLLSKEIDGVNYIALVPVCDDEDCEDEPDAYVLLKFQVDENGEEELVGIDEDDPDFDRIVEIFNDELFSEYDYDEEDGDE